MKKFLLLFITIILALLNLYNVYAQIYTLTYLFGGTSVTYTNYIMLTKGMLNNVCPDYFEIKTDGSLLLQKLDKSFIDNMHNADILVTPYLSNNWDKELGIKALNNSDAFTTQLADVIYQNNIDGVNVDIQNVSHEYREKYTNFVRLLREKMPDKKISVAVAANPYGWTQGWHGSYDYAALKNYSDFLMIMSYDESYYASPPGPVASSTFVEKSIQYTLKYVEPEKIILGIPFFGRYWKTGSSVGGYGITAKDVEYLIDNYTSDVTYDNNSQSVKAVVTINQNDKMPKLWGGKVLDPGQYTIWYDDIKALKYKLDLAEKYNLFGTGSWALGQENISIWDEYSNRKSPSSDINELDPEKDLNDENLSPTPLLDILNHWAYLSIANVYNKGWMTGVSHNKFAPERNLKRGEAATLLMRITGLDDIDEEKENDFNDTKKHWARKDIAKARYYGILNGRSNNMFYPDDSITREEMSLVIDKVFNLPETIDFNNNPFSDIDSIKNSWSYNSIIKLSESNVIKGYPNMTFRPKNKIIRAEIASLLGQLEGYGINSFITEEKIDETEKPTNNENEPVPEDESKGELEEIQLPR